MKIRMRLLLIACMTLLTVMLVSGCSGQKTPYQVNDEANYNVSVKFDPNGGFFGSTSTAIVDSYNISEIGKNAEGKTEIALLSPDNELRKDRFTASKQGHFLVGWYTDRTETVDENGQTVYTYSNLWDFDADRLTVDPNGSYTSTEPVLTLYAAWAPVFEVKYFNLATGEEMGSVIMDPSESTEIAIPQWDTFTGTVDMKKFPEYDGHTFNGVYLDAEGTQPVTEPTISHCGVLDYETGLAQSTSMNLYIDWMEGEWYHIHSAEQFVDNANLNGCYIIEEDLDFSDEIWPTALMHGTFNGTIVGNGHTMKNIHVTQTNNSKTNAGLFGSLSEKASITDLNLDNVTFTVQSGSTKAGTRYGLFAGSISEGLTLSNVKITNSTLQIDSGCYFQSEDYAIGLICGMGDASMVDHSGISCKAVGNAPETVEITLDGNAVNVRFVSE